MGYDGCGAERTLAAMTPEETLTGSVGKRGRSFDSEEVGERVRGANEAEEVLGRSGAELREGPFCASVRTLAVLMWLGEGRLVVLCEGREGLALVEGTGFDGRAVVFCSREELIGSIADDCVF